MAKEKTGAKVNYSEADVAFMRTAYTGADNATEVKAIADKLGKSPASVRAKLANLALYKTAEKAAGDAGESVKKRDLVEKIGAVTGLNDPDKDGLEKATKSALDKILKALVTVPKAEPDSAPQGAEDSGAEDSGAEDSDGAL